MRSQKLAAPPTSRRLEDRQAPKLWRPSNKHLVSEFELAAPYAPHDFRVDGLEASRRQSPNTAIVNQFPSFRFTAIYRPLGRRYLAKKTSPHQ
jgi:hypothetical protein